MRREPFFAGPGLDRAGAARARSARIAEFAQNPLARELLWQDGLPALGDDGSLQWRELSDPVLFLGLDGDAPRFCSLQQEVGAGPAAFAMLANLSPADAPVFAAALSLARWHSRHRFCATCGSESDVIRGGWSRKCAACSAGQYPRVDPVGIELAEDDVDPPRPGVVGVDEQGDARGPGHAAGLSGGRAGGGA